MHRDVWHTPSAESSITVWPGCITPSSWLRHTGAFTGWVKGEELSWRAQFTQPGPSQLTHPMVTFLAPHICPSPLTTLILGTATHVLHTVHEPLIQLRLFPLRVIEEVSIQSEQSNATLRNSLLLGLCALGRSRWQTWGLSAPRSSVTLPTVQFPVLRAPLGFHLTHALVSLPVSGKKGWGGKHKKENVCRDNVGATNQKQPAITSHPVLAMQTRG